MLLWHFLYMFLFTHPQAPFRQLGPSFPGSSLNKYDKICIFPSIYFMLKDHQKRHVGTRYKGNLISLLSSIINYL